MALGDCSLLECGHPCYIPSNWMMCIKVVGRIWNEGIVPTLTCHTTIFLKRLRKSAKCISHDSRSPGQNLNPGYPEYKALWKRSSRFRYSVGGTVEILEKHETRQSVLEFNSETMEMFSQACWVQLPQLLEPVLWASSPGMDNL
jgi:hypothetical protein